MSSSSIVRIGKSLLKYFKPIRVASPHVPGQSKTRALLGDKNKHEFKRFQSKDFEEKKNLEVVPTKDGKTDTTSMLPEKAPAHWLELVISLFSACQRASMKMRQRIGTEAYRKATLGGKRQFKSLGSILDTTPLAYESKQDKVKKEAA